MFHVNDKRMLLVCFIVHLIFLVSIFDIYFKSPIVEGIPPEENNIRAPAKRLVLIVGDGLRADSFFEIYDDNKVRAPYLRQIIEKRGRWGVSHTRVPTESRPGHVALIAGFYEDPSAIFKGWKDNPIEFDSVFNRSSITLGWGSPDILSMFDKGSDTKSRVIMESYPSSFEDFSGKMGSAAKSSWWSFERLKQLFEEAKTNNTIAKKLREEKLIIFLHLLGIDTAGHSDKPHSDVYTENIRIADKIARETELLINEFYENDNETVYIFTSDHGMTNWGSHGEGSADETETPFVAWGAGVSPPKVSRSGDSSGTPDSWRLAHLERNDMEQADQTPLMSVLLGVPIPVNSVGTLPIGILNMSVTDKSEALFLNARQILAQYRRKRELVEQTTLAALYKPYEKLTDTRNEQMISVLRTHLQKGYFDEVIKGCQDLIRLSLSGLAYYHNYYQKLLLFCVSASYIGWMVWLFLNVLFDERGSSSGRRRNSEIEQLTQERLLLLNVICITLLMIAALLLAVQRLPYQYYLYCGLPFYLWWNVLKKLISFHSNTMHKLFTMSLFCTICGTILGTELVVMSFFERRTLALVVMPLLLWPMLQEGRNMLSSMWTLSCVLLMMFPFLPVIGGKPNNAYILLSVSIWWLFIFVSWRVFSSVQFRKKAAKQYILMGLLFAIVLFNTLHVSYNYAAKEGLMLFNQFLSWIILFTVPLLPLMSTKSLCIRLLVISFSLGVVSVLFSINHDALFLPLFSFHLFLWVLMEYSGCENASTSKLLKLKFRSGGVREESTLSKDDFRRAFFFFYYTVFSFFGTGNIASINSFDTLWVRCFVALFSPFTMMTLILVKIIIPFFVTACAFRAVNEITKARVDKIFLIVLMYCDLMSLNFLFLVKNVGSWLEIGASVSHYVISQTIILFLVLLYFLSSYLIFGKFKNMKHKFSHCTFLDFSSHVD